MLQVRRLTTSEDLAPLRDAWVELAHGAPFCRPAWLGPWWKAYGTSPDSAQLCVAALTDYDGALVGLAPWYIERSATQGHVLRFLGSGEVCSDHVTLLCRGGYEDQVAAAVADWLAAGEFRWDLLELDGVDAADRMLGALADHLQRRGHFVDRRDGLPCWRLELPGDWDTYLSRLSKGHRKQVRRIVRNVFEGGRAELRTVETAGELATAVDQLIDLHQRRRQDLGQPGCFASAPFDEFIRRAAEELFGEGKLGMHVLHLDGRAVAAEFQLVDGGIVFAYQSGVEPRALEDQPGNLANLAVIRRAIADGRRAIDFLRGDEPYKAHWRAEPRPMCRYRIVPPRASARLRHGVWAAGKRIKRILKQTAGKGIRSL